MLLGFISLLLTVFQGMIAKICISEELASKWLPCDKKAHKAATKSTAHFESFFSSFTSHHGAGRRLLAESSASSDYCAGKGKVPLLSITALHHLHIFIFVLAVVHVTFCALTILFGGAKIRKWKQWEDSASKEEHNLATVQSRRYIQVQDHDFIKNRFQGLGKSYVLMGWLHSFFKQFYGSVTKSDYTTLRLGFIMTHCRGNPKFNFHKYLMRTLEADFKKVVGISWYLWLFVVIFLLINIDGWHTYFWIAFFPFISFKIMIINLFQVQYGFDSCIMGRVRFIIPRLVIGCFIQFICSYSTLPLYVIVTQMGSSFKKAIFDEHIQDGLVGWARMAKKKNTNKNAADGSSKVGHKEEYPSVIQLQKLSNK
ncbi:MLO-like protein 1 [Citrus sinensis]|nr:MLO-like protein 1 [Citrus sinensis]